MCTPCFILGAHDSFVILGLIAFRIWRTQRQTRDAKMGANLSHVSVIVIESGASKTFFYPRGVQLVSSCRSCLQTGAIYLTVLACNVAAFVLKSNLFNIFLDMVSIPPPTLPS